jgi:endonuclease-3|tara:strand:- start:1838 stop:2473 length:636 start_codon:yes stop_codon:yes gene_type:complete
MHSRNVKKFYTLLQSSNPKPETELQYKTIYHLLIAVVLSAQATDKSVNKATQTLFKKIKKPEDAIKMGEVKIRQYIKTIGLYKNKAKNVYQLSKKLIKEHNGIVPKNRELLESLPGVGRKTANVVLNVAFAIPTIAVDTHIFRVSNRTGIAKGKNPLEVEKKLLEVTPTEFKMYAHHWLILHGRYTCKARKPDCVKCIVSNLCEYEKKEIK